MKRVLAGSPVTAPPGHGTDWIAGNPCFAPPAVCGYGADTGHPVRPPKSTRVPEAGSRCFGCTGWSPRLPGTSCRRSRGPSVALIILWRPCDYKATPIINYSSISGTSSMFFSPAALRSAYFLIHASQLRPSAMSRPVNESCADVGVLDGDLLAGLSHDAQRGSAGPASFAIEDVAFEPLAGRQASQ